MSPRNDDIGNSSAAPGARRAAGLDESATPPGGPPGGNRRHAAVGALAAEVAHELNNLLGGILMAAQYAGGVLDRDDARALVQRALADIEADALRGGELIGSLLRFARADPAERVACEVAAIVEGAADLALEKGLPGAATIRCDVARSLPPLLAHGAEISQALAGVITDALQAGASGVEVRATRDGERVSITVTDDGERHTPAAAGSPVKARGGPGGNLALRLAHAAVLDHGGAWDVASFSTGTNCVTIQMPTFRRT